MKNWLVQDKRRKFKAGKQESIETRISELEKQLRETAYELYELASGKHRFIPFKGKVVVRVLPKDMVTSGGIFLPDIQQNKPVYEGIVVQIWEPWVEEKQVKRNGKMETDYITHRCPLQVGDRIAFPHHVGMPVGSYLDDKYYRILPVSDNFTEVLGTIDFHGDEEAKKTIQECTARMRSITTSGLPISLGDNPQEVAR